jgi:hypothetical protein
MGLFHKPLQVIVAQEVLPGDEQRPQHVLEQILGSGYTVTVAVGNAAVAQLVGNSDYYAAVLTVEPTKPHAIHSDDKLTTWLQAVLSMRNKDFKGSMIVVGQDVGPAEEDVLYIASVNDLPYALRNLPRERKVA